MDSDQLKRNANELFGQLRTNLPDQPVSKLPKSDTRDKILSQVRVPDGCEIVYADTDSCLVRKVSTCQLCHVNEADWAYRHCRRCKKVLCSDCSWFGNTDRVFCRTPSQSCIPKEGDDDYDAYD